MKYGVSISQEQLVSLPEITNLSELKNQFTFADFSGIGTLAVIKIALVMAIVASIETLLSVEATDKLDPGKKVTPTNRELKAQGLGNIISGLIGGLPITQVVVRNSAHITFGAKTKLSAILLGLAMSIFFALHHSYRNSYHLKDRITDENGRTIHHIVFA
ncbi:MAG: solute carrier family 23 protein [Sulfurovum sp.]|nr:solute carrier family 23 protein [Sulfurovum sp.]